MAVEYCQLSSLIKDSRKAGPNNVSKQMMEVAQQPDTPLTLGYVVSPDQTIEQNIFDANTHFDNSPYANSQAFHDLVDVLQNSTPYLKRQLRQIPTNEQYRLAQLGTIIFVRKKTIDHLKENLKDPSEAVFLSEDFQNTLQSQLHIPLTRETAKLLYLNTYKNPFLHFPKNEERIDIMYGLTQGLSFPETAFLLDMTVFKAKSIHIKTQQMYRKHGNSLRKVFPLLTEEISIDINDFPLSPVQIEIANALKTSKNYQQTRQLFAMSPNRFNTYVSSIKEILHKELWAKEIREIFPYLFEPKHKKLSITSSLENSMLFQEVNALSEEEDMDPNKRAQFPRLIRRLQKEKGMSLIQIYTTWPVLLPRDEIKYPNIDKETLLTPIQKEMLEVLKLDISEDEIMSKMRHILRDSNQASIASEKAVYRNLNSVIDRLINYGKLQEHEELKKIDAYSFYVYNLAVRELQELLILEKTYDEICDVILNNSDYFILFEPEAYEKNSQRIARWINMSKK